MAASYLVEVMKLRIQLRKLLVKEAEFDGRRLVFSFHEQTPVSPDAIIGLIRQQPKTYHFTPDFRLSVELTDTTFEGVLAAARNVLKRVS